MSLEDAARRLADEQRNKNAAAATAAEARQARAATPTPEGLEFVGFCRNHGVAPVPIRGYRQKRWSGKTVTTVVGHGWPLDVWDGDSRGGLYLGVREDGTVVTLTGHGPFTLGGPVDPTDLPRWAVVTHPSLADLLVRAAGNILIKKENGALRPPF
ncbi:hypothetical protein GCM10023205_32910 [Yinghuangia aomiensis]|uniref:Uncharacterized protein n=1 Tax=Yinghuangia aomiensis TaxID=676205 RepID=A0ABP9HAP8_9ACTN